MKPAQFPGSEEEWVTLNQWLMGPDPQLVQMAQQRLMQLHLAISNREYSSEPGRARDVMPQVAPGTQLMPQQMPEYMQPANMHMPQQFSSMQPQQQQYPPQHTPQQMQRPGPQQVVRRGPAPIQAPCTPCHSKEAQAVVRNAFGQSVQNPPGGDLHSHPQPVMRPGQVGVLPQVVRQQPVGQPSPDFGRTIEVQPRGDWPQLVEQQPQPAIAKQSVPARSAPTSCRTMGWVIEPTVFITSSRLTRDAITLLGILPPTIDCIVGIARSGLAPSAALSVHLHAPLYSVTRERGVIDLGGGYRTRDKLIKHDDVQHVLLFDDSVGQGTSMQDCAPLVQAAFPKAKLTRAAVYCNPEYANAVDYAYALYPGHQYLEWGLYNNGMGCSALTDFDGMLCEDCPADADDDGPKYRQFIQTATPRSFPRCQPLYTVVTARHEKYRELTMKWLTEQRLAVREVIMRDWDYQTNQSHDEQVGAWKAEVYRKSGLMYMIESSPAQCEIIHELTGKIVMCPPAERVWP